MDTASTEMKLDIPPDGFGADYAEYLLDAAMDHMMRFVGFDEMRARVAEKLIERANGRKR